MNKEEIIKQSRERLEVLNNAVLTLDGLFKQLGGRFSFSRPYRLISEICDQVGKSDFLSEAEYVAYFNALKAMDFSGDSINNVFIKLSRDFCSFSFIEFFSIGLELLQIGIGDTGYYPDTHELFFEGKVEFWTAPDEDPSQEHFILTTPSQVWQYHNALK